jgi:hypothetical protein
MGTRLLEFEEVRFVINQSVFLWSGVFTRRSKLYNSPRDQVGLIQVWAEYRSSGRGVSTVAACYCTSGTMVL